jgi:SWI/SNF-related matrix-associated actin-dependent regulator of chromatin subfamily A3
MPTGVGRQPKRKLSDAIDLTALSSDEEFPSSLPAPGGSYKKAKTSSNSTVTTGPGGRQYLTPPSSSNVRPSQYGHNGRSSSFNVYSSQTSYGNQHSQRERDSWLASTQDQEDEISREIDLTADDDDDIYDGYQLYGILNTKIVGCRFYDGRATIGEYVKVRREPGNPYDRNAFRIDNCVGDQIGHIGRQVAAKLAALFDSKELLIEGALTGPKTAFECPIGLKLFGTSDPVAQADLKQKMQDLRLPVNELARNERERKQQEKDRVAREKAAKSMKKGGGQVVDHEGPNKYANIGTLPSGSQPVLTMENVLSNTAMFNPRDVQDAVNKFVAGEATLEKMTLAQQPSEMATRLLPYQLQGLHWMLQKEAPKLPEKDADEPVQLWKRSYGLYTNIATNFSLTKAPTLARGGILADDMGLGKTIQIISLIMADPQKDGLPTLIVAPLSVMSNWRQQAELHVTADQRPKVLTYHGQDNRWLTPDQFAEYDIVVTTYATMSQELFPSGKDKAVKTPSQKGLFSLKWRRIVLDEGHNIRNPKTKMSIAACTLEATSRWTLTGTPIINSLKDLYAQVKFLRISGGLDEYEVFNTLLVRPLKRNDPNARVLLQALMATLCLRRMKDFKFIDLKLPGISFHQYPVKLLSHEQERYDAFKHEAKGLLEAAKAKKGDSNTMTNLLEVLLRLRQTCNHWKMCGEARLKRVMELVEENKAVDVTNIANRKALQDLLQVRIDSQEECPVCYDTMRSPVITACSHAYCQQCIERVIEVQHKCPMCRADLPTIESLVAPAANFGEADEEIEIDADSTSSKIEALIKVLKAAQNEKGAKCVVFSQWTSFLDLVQTQLIKHNLRFCRLDGKLSTTQRDTALEMLNTDDSCRIMLASLSVCSVGLNLVAANTVVLCDSWWAPVSP